MLSTNNINGNIYLRDIYIKNTKTLHIFVPYINIKIAHLIISCDTLIRIIEIRINDKMIIFR